MFNSLAALSALALVTLLLVTTTNGSALHIGGSRIWIELHELSWQVDIPDGSGRRTILALYSPLVFLFLTCFPIAWALQKWRSHERRTSQPRLPLLQFLLLLLLITWLPLISMLYGPSSYLWSFFSPSFPFGCSCDSPGFSEPRPLADGNSASTRAFVPNVDTA
jgi:hypothetical protein